MTAKKKPVITTADVEVAAEKENIVVLRVTRKITKEEHEDLSKKIRFENRETGLKIVLAASMIDEVEIEKG